MSNNTKVLQPMRFVDAHYTFTPTQRDFIMLIQHQTNKKKAIKNDFKIDLKPYFKAKGIELSNIRTNHYTDMCKDLLSAKVGFQYFKGDTLFSYYNLFSRCSIDRDFNLNVTIIDESLPLFYINKLQAGHFKDNKLVKELFQQSYPEIDKYVAFHAKTYVELKEGSEKKLFEKLLQYRKLKTKIYEFSKDELYLLLGFGQFEPKTDAEVNEQQILFDLGTYDFIQTKYIGNNGWKNLRPALNNWLQTISEHENTGLTIKKYGKNYFKTVGRPIRSVYINVVFDEEQLQLNDDQRKSYEYLKPFLLSDNQVFVIVSKFKYEAIKANLRDFVIKKRDHNNKVYYGEYKRGDHRKIENLPGYVYSVVFDLGKK